MSATKEITDNITFEFPSIRTNGTYFDLGLRSVVNTKTYRLTFIKKDLDYMIMYGNWKEYLCYAEYWIINNYYKDKIKKL